jgi:hypothetical protein
MKKKILLSVVLLVSMTSLFADNNLTTPALTIPQGGSGDINIELNNDKAYTAFTMKLTFPDGISYSSFAKSNRFTDSHSVSAIPNGQTISFGCLSTSNESITGYSGVLLSITVSADESLAVGSEYTAVISDVKFSTTSGEETLDDVNITITIGENRIVLDEDATTAPAAAEDVNVTVKRTINANSWSTICLPFAMSEAQCKAAFGDDVQIGDFKGCEVDDDDNIKVKFADVTAIEKNHPYIILVSKAISEFTADGVDVNPDDAEVKLDKSGRRYNSFIGNYTNGTTLEDGMLFLNGSKFYFSAGNTVMKGYRGYFNLDAAGAYYESRLFIRFDDATGVDNISISTPDDSIYTLSGQRVDKPSKGLYIRQGKKVIIK